MNISLKLKHWQVFLIRVLTIGVSLIVYFQILVSLENPIFAGFVLPLIVIILNLPYFIWLFAIAKLLVHSSPTDATQGYTVFKRRLLFVLIYSFMLTLVSASLCFFAFFMGIVLFALCVIAIPLNILCIVRFYQCLLYIAKVIQQKMSGHDNQAISVTRLLVLLHFFSIGIWVLQPKFNRWSKM